VALITFSPYWALGFFHIFSILPLILPFLNYFVGEILIPWPEWVQHFMGAKWYTEPGVGHRFLKWKIGAHRGAGRRA